jgi:hypothetical protein
MTSVFREYGYLERPYMTDAYMAGSIEAGDGWQVSLLVAGGSKKNGWQTTRTIASTKKTGWQVKGVIASTKARGWQVLRQIVAHKEYRGWQTKRTIASNKKVAWQTQRVIHHVVPTAWQILTIHTAAYGWQVRSSLYNAKKLRILYQFSSRGATTSDGVTTNAWGELVGTGLNWVASTTAASATDSFNVSNLNTDIVEQRWQGATAQLTNVRLDCDTEISQGILLDTFAMLETNFSASASVQLLGSNTDDFSVIDQTIVLDNDGDGNFVYVAEDQPHTFSRYWRILIDDASNSDHYLRAGAVVFGSAMILTEDFVDQVGLEPQNFTDEVFTEGFTNVQNDRGLKNLLHLSFRNLRYDKGNYQALKSFFNYARTVLKALWIPTPEYPKRYMLFGKMRRMPAETHNVKGVRGDLVTFNVDIDESK